jgi:hypothetical protein
MGLAGLLQAAEMAWQQDEDWYSSSDHALAAAVELHARIVRAAADRDEQMLPQGFRFFESMPRPPMGMFWKYDLERQIWAAHNSTTSVRVMDKTKDNFKYMVGLMGWRTVHAWLTIQSDLTHATGTLFLTDRTMLCPAHAPLSFCVAAVLAVVRK